MIALSKKKTRGVNLESLEVTAHLAFEPTINASPFNKNKSKLPRQANIAANDISRDYRCISQPPLACLWLKTCECGQGLGLRIGEVPRMAYN